MRALLLIFSIVLVSCNSSRQVVDKAAQLNKLDELLTEKEFELDVEWAYPLVTNDLNAVLNSLNSAVISPTGDTSGSIYVSDQNAYLKVKGDNISAELPYYGSHTVGGAGTINNSRNIGISFDGIPEDLVIKKNEKRSLYKITFNINSIEKRENYQVSITMFPNESCNIVINSSHRTSITYKGKIADDNEEKVAVK